MLQDEKAVMVLVSKANKLATSGVYARHNYILLRHVSSICLYQGSCLLHSCHLGFEKFKQDDAFPLCQEGDLSCKVEYFYNPL